MYVCMYVVHAYLGLNWLSPSFYHIRSFDHSFIHSFIHSFTHSLIIQLRMWGVYIVLYYASIQTPVKNEKQWITILTVFVDADYAGKRLCQATECQIGSQLWKIDASTKSHVNMHVEFMSLSNFIIVLYEWIMVANSMCMFSILHCFLYFYWVQIAS